MIFKWVFMLCVSVKVHASLNFSYQDLNPGVCVKNILSKIVESNHLIYDVSLINNNDAVIQEIQGVKRLRFVTRTNNWHNNEIYNIIYVMNFNDYNEMINEFHIVMDDRYWTPFSNFIIILERLDYNLIPLQKFLIYNNLFNVTVLSKEENDYNIYTFYSPIRPCNHSSCLIKTTNCSMSSSYIFPTMSKTGLRGCSFKFVAKNFYPLVDFDSKDTEGLEERIVRIFSEQHNMVINLMEYYKINKLGRIVGNYNYVDMLNMVHDNKAEAAVGGYFVELNKVGKFSFGYPVRIDHIITIMPRAKFYDTWHAVYYKNFYVIMFVFILIIVFSVLAYYLALFPSHEADITRDIMIIFGYFLNKVTVRDLKNGIPEGIIIGSLLFSVFIIPYSMQAFFYSVKTNPIRGVEVKNHREISANYQLIVPVDWGNITSTLPNSMTCVSRLDCLRRVMQGKERTQYTIIGDLLYQAYKWMLIDDQCTADVYNIRDPIATKMRTIYFRSGSILVQPYNKFTLQYASGGFLNKHLSDLVLVERLKCHYRGKPKYNPLSLAEAKHSFLLLIGGYCLSAICFAYEVTSKRR